MWKHCSTFVCALGLLAIATSTLTTATTDPSSLPLLQFSDLMYTGAFRLPDTTVNGDTFNIGGRTVAYNPARNSLFIGSRAGRIAEVSIPTPLNSTQINSLPRASFLQGFVEPTEGHLAEVTGDVAIAGILVHGDRIYGTASIYYDALNLQRVSHYGRSTTLNQPSFSGWSSVWDDAKSGYVAGFMALVPTEWQEKLGGPAITGQCCIPIVTRTSWGPSAYAFNPADIGRSDVKATPLLYYDGAHPTLGPWSGSGPIYGATTMIEGVAVIAGTRTVLFFGRNGVGNYCYGNGTSNKSLVGTVGLDGAHYCYDPTNSDKGQHAYPYQYQIWAYDLNDLAAVKAGTKQPWDVVPYGVWPFAFPTTEPSIKIGGIGYDSQRQIIYVSQMRADPDGYDNRPLIHALKVGGVAGAPLPAPAPSSSPSEVNAVSLSANKAAPQPPGTNVLWSAVPSGGVAPHQYRWLVHDGAKWTPLTGWSTSNTFSWTPTIANSSYQLSVWVRSAGNTADAPEASNAKAFAIEAAAAPVASKVSAVALTANKTAPQAPSTTITFTAAPSGGAAPYQYKWWIFDGSAWIVSGSWTSSNTFAWTPTTANSNYKVSAWVRSAGNSRDEAESSFAISFPIAATTSTSSPAPTTTTPPPSTSTKVSYVSMTASKASPQAPGTSIMFAAAPTGGVAPHQYKWWVYDGSKWNIMVNWSGASTFTWTPTKANAQYKVTVWVRSAGKTADVEEYKATIDFPISATSTPSTSTPTTTNARVTTVTLSANKVSPQLKGTSITFTATPSGGVTPYSYKFYVWDGSTWLVVRGWSTSNTFTWTPTMVNPYYKVAVWVNSAGNSSDNYEATTSIPFSIK